MRVLGKAAGVEVKRDTRFSGDAADFADIRHRDRLPAARIVGHRDHDQRNAIAIFRDEFFQRPGVHVAFERVCGGQVICFLAEQVDGFGAGEFDVRARRVEVRVVRNDAVGPSQEAEQDVLGGAALVSRYHLLETEDVFHRVPEPVPAAGTRV